MRAPLSWLREYAELPPDVSGRDLAERLIAAGLEVESVEQPGAEITGDVLVGRVLAFTDEEHSNGKTIRWCTVDVGEAQPRGIVCGALNFADGDLVVVALPGATLPGGFEIAARKTYGHVSDGMICSARELGLGDDHHGILVLPPTTADVGADAVSALGLRDEVLDIAVTPDRGYALSIRGVAREAATAYGVAFRDPADVEALPVGRRRASRRDRRPDSRRPAGAAHGDRARPARAEPAGAAAPVAAERHAPGVPGGRRDELRDARDGPAAARLRPDPARRADRRSPGAARGSGWRRWTT